MCLVHVFHLEKRLAVLDGELCHYHYYYCYYYYRAHPKHIAVKEDVVAEDL